MMARPKNVRPQFYEPDSVGCVTIRANLINARAIDRKGIAQAKSAVNPKHDADLHAASRQFTWPI